MAFSTGCSRTLTELQEIDASHFDIDSISQNATHHFSFKLIVTVSDEGNPVSANCIIKTPALHRELALNAGITTLELPDMDTLTPVMSLQIYDITLKKVGYSDVTMEKTKIELLQFEKDPLSVRLLPII